MNKQLLLAASLAALLPLHAMAQEATETAPPADPAQPAAEAAPAAEPAQPAAPAAETVPVAEPVETKAPASRTYPGEAHLYYVPSNKLHGSGQTISGNGGFGIGGSIQFGPEGGVRPFLIGDYQQTRYSDYDQTEKNERFGLGAQFTPTLGAYADYVAIKFHNTLDGIGIHLRTSPQWGEFSLLADIGYLSLKNDRGPDVDGFDGSIGGAFRFANEFSAFADYRVSVLSPKGGGDSLTLTDVRVGVRVALGAAR